MLPRANALTRPIPAGVHRRDKCQGTTSRGCGKALLSLAREDLQSRYARKPRPAGRSFQLYSFGKARAPEPSLRRMREMVDRALQDLSLWFDQLYAKTGRPSIPPEQLLRALILQVLYTMRSERQLMDQIDHSWRYRWFVGLKADDPVWDVTVFTKNRERLMAGEVSQKFFDWVLEQPAGARATARRTLHRGRQLDRGLGQPEQLREEEGPTATRHRSARAQDVSGHP
jgi:hypothetical protein